MKNILKADKKYNPVIFADYSDPDVIRVKDTYYLTASSFNYTPGLPILTSKDLINWKIAGYALENLGEGFEFPRQSEGVWAPSIRYYDGVFYIYYGMPDEGIFVVTSKDPLKGWEKPVCVLKVKGFIDPCPIFMEDGKKYIIHAYAKSRIGFKSFLGIFELSDDGLKSVSEDRFIFDGNIVDASGRENKNMDFKEKTETFEPSEKEHPAITIEGPKVYRRNGYFYILAPAGGVVRGWQLALRSKYLKGPYESKIVMHQGDSLINGPHQGGLIDTEDGREYFIHFQDRGMFGRICHIQPVSWENDWPVIGICKDGSGCGQPVYELEKIGLHNLDNSEFPDMYNDPESMSDDFKDGKPSYIWQWLGDHRSDFTGKRKAGEKGLILNALNDKGKEDLPLGECSNILTMKLTRPEFVTSVYMDVSKLKEEDRAGLLMTGGVFFSLEIKKNSDGGYEISVKEGDKERRLCHSIKPEDSDKALDIAFRFSFKNEEETRDKSRSFASVDEKNPLLKAAFRIGEGEFEDCNLSFRPIDDKWVGAKLGIYCISKGLSGGFAEFKCVKTD
ncbi:MAG: glycoside hydrolase 43 family protein [Lachnospiraceae bacterium]|nr:glycoside hydrolase 43 family protein [Lachnospiraceae bacterium]